MYFVFAAVCDNVPNRSAADDDKLPHFLQLHNLHALFLTSNPGNNYFPVRPKYHILSVNISSYYDHIHLQNYFQSQFPMERHLHDLRDLPHTLLVFLPFCMAM